MNTRQDRRYLKYLAPTLKRVMRSLTHFPEYKPLLNVLIDSGAFPNITGLRVADNNIFPNRAPTYLAPRVGLVNSTRG